MILQLATLILSLFVSLLIVFYQYLCFNLLRKEGVDAQFLKEGEFMQWLYVYYLVNNMIDKRIYMVVKGGKSHTNIETDEQRYKNKIEQINKG